MSNSIDEHSDNHGGWVEAVMPSMKKYFGKLHERNGEYEYTHSVLFETDAYPMAEMARRAREFYGDVAEEKDGGFYFFCGGIYVATESVVEVTEEEYAVLIRYI